MPPLAEIADMQGTLDDLSTLAAREIASTFAAVSDRSALEISDFMVAAVPDIVDPYAATSGEFSAQWYDDQKPGSSFRAKPADLPEHAALEASTRWALSPLFGGGSGDPVTMLAGAAQRSIVNTSRNTIVDNAEREPGTLWARHASAGACAFCALLATRGAVYSSKAAAGAVRGRGRDRATTRGEQKAGGKYHDHCNCIAVPVRAGDTYEPPEYVRGWEAAYLAATRETAGKGPNGAIDLKAVLAHMSQSDAIATPETKSAIGQVSKAERATALAAGQAAEQAAAKKALAAASRKAARERKDAAAPPLEFDRREGQSWASKIWPYGFDSKRFTEEQKLEVYNYTGFGYERTNATARGLIEPMPFERNRIAQIDAAIERAARVPRNVTVTRTAAPAAFGNVSKLDAQALVGRTFHDDGFLSTSVEATGVGEVADGKAAPDFLLRITVPKGTKAIYVSNENAGVQNHLSGFGRKENELIVGRGADLRVDRVEVPDDPAAPVTLHVTLLGQTPKEIV